MACACTDIRYRPTGEFGRVSVCMDCGEVHKVWQDAPGPKAQAPVIVGPLALPRTRRFS